MHSPRLFLVLSETLTLTGHGDMSVGAPLLLPIPYTPYHGVRPEKWDEYSMSLLCHYLMDLNLNRATC